MKSKIYKSIIDINNLKLSKTRLKLIMYSVLVGILTGIVVVFYRVSIDKAIQFRNYLFDRNNIFLVLVLFFISVNSIQFMLSLFPLISGSGIPQVMGLLKKTVAFNWFFELIFKFIGGILGIFVGMSLGREGPSIHLGALVADGVNKVSKRTEIEKKFLATAGASAGLAAAFNAPLSGTIFAIEELHKFFSPLLLICTILASIFANFVAQLFLGRAVVFNNFNFFVPFQENLKPILIELVLIFILSIIIILSAKLFNYSLTKFQDIYKSIKLNKYIKISLFALMCILIIKFIPDVSGGGHSLIEELVLHNVTIKYLLVLLFFKFTFTMASYSTGTPGGIFLPLLVIGAIIGKIYGMIVVNIFGLPYEYTVHFMLLAMASYFAAIVKSPITGIVLVLELTGNFSNLFPLTIVSAVTYVMSELCKLDSVYEILYTKMFKKSEDKKTRAEDDNMTAFRIPVISGSAVEGKMVKDIKWPDNMLIIGIERNNIEFIPCGTSKIYAGDQIIIFTDNQTARTELEKIFDYTLKEEIE